MKNTLAQWMIDYFASNKLEAEKYFASLDSQDFKDLDGSELAAAKRKFEDEYPFSSLGAYLKIKLVGYTNDRPVMTLVLAGALVYNFVYLTVKATQFLLR